MFRITFVALLLTFIHAATASAELRFFEGFDYTESELLVGQVNTYSGTRSWGKPATNPPGMLHTIAGGDLEYPGLEDAEDSNSVSVPRAYSISGVLQNSQARINIPGAPFARNGLGTLYFSFTMKMTDFVEFSAPTENPSDTNNDAAAKSDAHRKGGFIAGFHGGDATAGGNMQSANGFAAPIYLRREIDYSSNGTDGTLGFQTGRYQIGVAKSASAILEPLPEHSELVYDTSLSYAEGETVLIVGQYTFVDSGNVTPVANGADIAKVWVNPTPGAAEPVATWEAPTAPNGVTNYPNLGGTLPIWSFHIRSDNILPGNFQVDNVRVGDTFADVTPAASVGTDGDFNDDGVVDAADYVAWRKNVPGTYTEDNYNDFVRDYGSTIGEGGSGSVPEPSTMIALVLGAMTLLPCRSRR